MAIVSAIDVVVVNVGWQKSRLPCQVRQCIQWVSWSWSGTQRFVTTMLETRIILRLGAVDGGSVNLS